MEPGRYDNAARYQSPLATDTRARSPGTSPTEVKVLTFKPGELGIKADWQTGLITNVEPGKQADRFGVKVGWAMCRLGDRQYTEERFDALLAGNQSYSVTF